MCDRILEGNFKVVKQAGKAYASGSGRGWRQETLIYVKIIDFCT